MSDNKITYISDDAKNKADIVYIDNAINTAIASFLKGEPIKDIINNINRIGQNRNYSKFNNWVWDKDAFQNMEYAWLISEEDIFMPDEDIFDYYYREDLDLKTDQDILNFMHRAIDTRCDDGVAYHYALYKGVYISASCEIWGQAGAHWSDFCIYKTEKDFWNTCEDYIISSDKGIQTSDTELISIFKKNITDKYFKD